MVAVKQHGSQTTWERLALETQERFPAPAWQIAEAEDVAIATRARIARNLPDHPFPHRADSSQRQAIAEQLCPAVRKAILGRHESFSMASLRPEEREYLLGQRLISPQFAFPHPHAWLIVDAPRTISVLVNEEDHLRVQAMMAGLQPLNMMEHARGVADRVESIVRFAYRSGTGYLAASPFNVGSGVRISVMLHLLGLSVTGGIAAAVDAAQGLGIVVRGLYGEGSRAVGGYFQLSLIGEPNAHTTAKLNGAAGYLIDQERRARRKLDVGEKRSRLAEATAFAQRAAALRFTDCLRILSWIRLGAVEQLLGAGVQQVDRWAAVMEIGAKDHEQMNRRRARYLREVLTDMRDGK